MTSAANQESAMRFQDRVVIVTGGAGGIGLATARSFGKEGAHVVIADYEQDKAEAAASALSCS